MDALKRIKVLTLPLNPQQLTENEASHRQECQNHHNIPDHVRGRARDARVFGGHWEGLGVDAVQVVVEDAVLIVVHCQQESKESKERLNELKITLLPVQLIKLHLRLSLRWLQLPALLILPVSRLPKTYDAQLTRPAQYIDITQATLPHIKAVIIMLAARVRVVVAVAAIIMGLVVRVRAVLLLAAVLVVIGVVERGVEGWRLLTQALHLTMLQQIALVCARFKNLLSIE